MEGAVILLIALFMVVFNIVIIPLCLVVVLGLFGLHISFITSLAIVIIVRLIFKLLRGN